MQEFYLKYISAKSKKLLIYAELIFDIPSLEEYQIHEDSFMDMHIFLILIVDPCYGDIIIYFHTLRVPSHLLRDER